LTREDVAWRSCGRKAAFETFEEASALKGQYAYKCRRCAKWHRSGSAIQIAKKIANAEAFRPSGMFEKPGRAARRRGAR